MHIDVLPDDSVIAQHHANKAVRWFLRYLDKKFGKKKEVSGIAHRATKIRGQRPAMGVTMSQTNSSDPNTIPDTVERESSEAVIEPTKIRKPRTRRSCPKTMPKIPTEQSLLRVPKLKITKEMLKTAGPKPKHPEIADKLKKARAALYHDFDNEKVTVAKKCFSNN